MSETGPAKVEEYYTWIKTLLQNVSKTHVLACMMKQIPPLMVLLKELQIEAYKDSLFVCPDQMTN